jgi:hypothetical protein
MIYRLMVPVVLIASLLGFSTATSRLEKIHRMDSNDEMSVALPKFIQVLMAGGDRFLAANINVFRSLTVDFETEKSDRVSIEAQLQQDASWFNPRHEDNYYLAAALLTWSGNTDAAKSILGAASDTRPYDMLPPFYSAFIRYYFDHNPADGIAWLNIAAQHTSDDQQRLGLEKLAALWASKESDRQLALKFLDAMAAQSSNSALKSHIEKNKARVMNLILIEQAAAAFHLRTHRFPATVDTLLQSGELKEIPTDPLGAVYALDSEGHALTKHPGIAQ